MNRQTVIDLRGKIQKALDAAGIEGFSIKVGNANFTEASAIFKVEAATIGANGEIRDRKADDFQKLAGMYGLKPSDLGKIFSFRHETFTVTGLNPKSSKYPVLAKRNSDGRGFKFPVDVIKRDPAWMDKVAATFQE